MQCVGDLIAMEGTNANGALPDRQHTSATSSPRATFTPTFQITGPLWKNNGFSAADMFAACAEPTPDNQYTTFKHRFGMRLPLMRNQLPTTSTPHHLLLPPHAFAAYAEPTPNNQYTAVTFS